MPRHARDENEAAAKLKTLLEPLLRRNDYVMAEKLIDAIGETGATDDDPDPAKMWPHRVGGAEDHRFAMDAALPGDREAAIAMVESRVGRATVLGCNSAAEVFRTALVTLGCDSARTVHRSALLSLWEMRRNAAGTNGQALPPRLDPAAAKGFGRLIGGRSPRVL